MTAAKAGFTLTRLLFWLAHKKLLLNGLSLMILEKDYSLFSAKAQLLRTKETIDKNAIVCYNYNR